MRVALVNIVHGPELATPGAVVARDPLRRELARELAALGHEVRVFQEWRGAPAALVDAHVPPEWSFHACSPITRAGAAVLRGLGRGDPVVHAPSTSLLDPVCAWRPEIVHSFDLVFHPSLLLLGRVADQLGAGLVAHYHGGAPARRRPVRLVERAALARVDRLLFTDAERAARWPVPAHRTALVPETSTTIEPLPRDEARAATGWEGDPLCLTVGRLDPVKDPLLLVRGFARFAETHPRATLHWLHREAPMLDEVRGELTRQGVAGRVFLHGAWPWGRMEQAYSSADLYLQASRREVCGVSVLEALATGLPTVLADISPWRAIAGTSARFFPVGDAEGLARAAASADRSEGFRARVRADFRAHLSFPALARRCEAVYREVLAERRAAR